MKRLYKYLLITLLIILFTFNGKSTYAFINNDTLIKNPFELKQVNSFDSIIESLYTYDDMNTISIINKDSFNNYIEFGENYIFRIKDNSVELLELSPLGSRILTSVTLSDMYVRNLSIANNYLVITGDQINSVSDMNSPFSIFTSKTSIKILNIEDLSNIKIDKELSVSGTLIKVIVSDNYINVFSRYKPYTDDLSGLNFLPYYVDNGIKSYFSSNEIYTIPHKETELNYLCAMTFLLDDNVELIESKAVWGVGQSIYSDDDYLYLTSSIEDNTRIIKLSIGETLFLNNSSISVPGRVTSYDAFNIENNKLKIITDLKNNKDKTFAIYLLDENLNIEDAYFMNKSALIESFYFVQDNLFIKYNDRINCENSDWLALSFDSNSISLKDPKNAISGYTYYSEEYIFALEVLPNTQLNMRVYDWDYTLIDSVDVLIKNSITPNQLMIYDNINMLLALPVVLDVGQKIECILTFKKTEQGKVDVNLISPEIVSNDIPKSYIDQMSEYMTINGDYLYTISPTTVTAYDLKNYTMKNRSPLE